MSSSEPKFILKSCDTESWTFSVGPSFAIGQIMLNLNPPPFFKHEWNFEWIARRVENWLNKHHFQQRLRKAMAISHANILITY